MSGQTSGPASLVRGVADSGQPFTITREPWHNLDEGYMEYRGVRVRFDFGLPCGPAVRPVEREWSVEMLDVQGDGLPLDINSGLAEWRRRFDAMMTRLAVLLERAGEPRPGAGTDGGAA